MTAADLLDALVKSCGRDVIWASELSLSSGKRRCDFWTLAPHQSKGYAATAYEIKISRADFFRDSREKQREARLFSDQFFYVTPPELLKPVEVPDWAGLLEIDSAGTRKTIVRAPIRDKDLPSWELVVSLLRYSGEIRRDEDIVKLQRNNYRNQLEEASKLLREKGEQPWKFGIHL